MGGTVRPVRPGSAEHRSAMCTTFLESHRPLEVANVEWPDLNEQERAFLARLPIWDEAVNTERDTALVVRAMAEAEADPLLAEAIALQALEEERHSLLITALCEHYGLTVGTRPLPDLTHPVWAFRRSGWGECVDSFVAFGVFAVAKEAEIVAKELISLFDTVMQEEARHIVFFENWRLYRHHQSGPIVSWTSDMAALAADLAQRIRLAFSTAATPGGRDDNFMLGGARALEGVTPRSFLDLCLAEHGRRVSVFGPGLRRPATVPVLARALRPLLPDRPIGGG